MTGGTHTFRRIASGVDAEPPPKPTIAPQHLCKRKARHDGAAVPPPPKANPPVAKKAAPKAPKQAKAKAPAAKGRAAKTSKGQSKAKGGGKGSAAGRKRGGKGGKAPSAKEVRVLSSYLIFSNAKRPGVMASHPNLPITARQLFAEHFFGLNTLRCKATARILIPAKCSGSGNRKANRGQLECKIFCRTHCCMLYILKTRLLHFAQHGPDLLFSC